VSRPWRVPVLPRRHDWWAVGLLLPAESKPRGGSGLILVWPAVVLTVATGAPTGLPRMTSTLLPRTPRRHQRMIYERCFLQHRQAGDINHCGGATTPEPPAAIQKPSP